MMARGRTFAVQLGLTWMLVGCGGAAVTAPVATSPSLPPLGDPAEVVPEGADWVLIADPRRVFADPVLRPMVDVLLPPQRVARWTERYGVDISGVERVAVGGYADGTLLVARGGIHGPRVVDGFADQMEGVETQSQQPMPRVTGVMDGRRYRVLAAEPAGLLLAEGDPEGWVPVVAHLHGQSARAPKSAAGQAALYGAVFEQSAPFSLLMLAPLSLPIDSPLGQVLAGQRQAAVTLSPTSSDSLRLWVALTGEFPATIVDNLRTFAEALSQQPLGAALGIAASLDTLHVDHIATGVVATLDLPSARLSHGLQVLFGTDLAAMLAAD